MADAPDSEQLSRYFSQMGKKGAKARNQNLTAERRKEIATKASKAAAVARKKKAKQKYAQCPNPRYEGIMQEKRRKEIVPMGR